MRAPRSSAGLSPAAQLNNLTSPSLHNTVNIPRFIMKFTLLLTLFTLSATISATATPPNASNTNLQINTAPHTAISKSRVTTKLSAREPFMADDKTRVASTNTATARSAMNGMNRRSRTVSSYRTTSAKAQTRPTHLPARERSTEAQYKRRSGMAKARRQRTRTADQQRREPKFLPTRQ